MSSFLAMISPDRIAVFNNDEENPCYKYDGKAVRTSLRVNPHIWKILKKFDIPKDVFPCFITCIQSIRIIFAKKPECLKSYGIIFKDGADLIEFKNGSYSLL